MLKQDIDQQRAKRDKGGIVEQAGDRQQQDSPVILFLPRKAERQKCHPQRHRLPLGIVGIAIIQAEVGQPAIGHRDILLILHQPNHKQAAGQQVHHKVKPMDTAKTMGRQIDQRHKQRLRFVPLPDAGQQTVLQLCICHPFLIHHAVRANGRVP